MTAIDQQILSGLLREPRHREVFSHWLEAKIQSSLSAMRLAVQQGKWKDAAITEGSLRAYEELLSELNRV